MFFYLLLSMLWLRSCLRNWVVSGAPRCWDYNWAWLTSPRSHIFHISNLGTYRKGIWWLRAKLLTCLKKKKGIIFISLSTCVSMSFKIDSRKQSLFKASYSVIGLNNIKKTISCKRRKLSKTGFTSQDSIRNQAQVYSNFSFLSLFSLDIEHWQLKGKCWLIDGWCGAKIE